MYLPLAGCAFLLTLAHPLRRSAGRAGAAHSLAASPSNAGQLPAPNGGAQQTACVVFDADGDGVNDIVLAERTQAPP